MARPLMRPVMLRSCARICSILLLLLAIPSVAQIKSRKDKKKLFQADKYYEFGDYLNAMKGYKALYPLDSMNAELNYKLGVCHYEIRKLRDDSKKYFDRTSAIKYPETDYYLGMLNHRIHQFDLALEHFHKYLELKSDTKEHTRKEIEDLIEKCHTAALFEAHPDAGVKISNIGPTINTEYAEYAPLIPAEEDFVIFTSRRKNLLYDAKDPLGDYFEDIYVSRRMDSVWGPPMMLDTSINKPYHDAATGLSADGEKLLSYHTSPDHIHGHIYESTLNSGTWSAPELLHNNVNSDDHIETSACYSPDGDIIFFSSTRPGGYGGKDLYSVKKLPNGKWAMPMNLGPTINTEYNEDAPFVHPSDSILFFSSEGHKNMGGYDVFKSHYDEREIFTPPVNLHSPVNTVDDDIFFVLTTDLSKGYFSSKRDDGYGSYDIYTAYFEENNIPLSVYNIHVYDAQGEVIKNVQIRLSDVDKHETVGEYRSNKLSGKVIIISRPDKAYRLTIESPGYEPLIRHSVQFGKELSMTFKMVKKHS